MVELKESLTETNTQKHSIWIIALKFLETDLYITPKKSREKVSAQHPDSATIKTFKWPT